MQMENNMEDLTFFEDLLDVFRKHKKNGNVEIDDGYEAFITGAWEINKYEDAVQIYKKEEKMVASIKGKNDFPFR